MPSMPRASLPTRLPRQDRVRRDLAAPARRTRWDSDAIGSAGLVDGDRAYAASKNATKNKSAPRGGALKKNSPRGIPTGDSRSYACSL